MQQNEVYAQGQISRREFSLCNSLVPRVLRKTAKTCFLAGFLNLHLVLGCSSAALFNITFLTRKPTLFVCYIELMQSRNVRLFPLLLG